MPPVPVYMKFYIFQVENPDNVTAGIQKPRLKEKGPYAYREERRKVKLTTILKTFERENSVQTS